MADDASTSASISPTTGKVDRITVVLFCGTIFFAIFLVVTDKLFPNDGQVFQVLATLTASFSGAFFGRVVPHQPTPGPPAAPPSPAKPIGTPLP